MVAFNTRPTRLIKTDKYDERAYAEITEQSSRLRAAEEAYGERVQGAGDIMADLWASIYKARPEKLDPVPGNLATTDQVLKQAEDVTDWETLRRKCKLDEFASAVATASLTEKLYANLPPKTSNAHNKVQKILKDLKAAQGEADAYAEAAAEGGDAADGFAAKAADAAGKAGKLEGKLEKAEADLAAAAEEEADAVRKAVRKAIENAHDDVDEANDMVKSFGSDPGSLTNVPVKAKWELANKIRDSHKLTEIAKKAGRFVRLALEKQETKTVRGRDVLTGVTVGADIARIIPAEFATMKHPVMRRAFYRKFLQKELLQYKTEGQGKLGRGPIVVCIDNSGSMSGDREIWAKAFAMGLLQIAKKQKRAAAVIHFGSKSEILKFRFPKDGSGDILSSMEYFFNGGTCFEEPLDEAIKEIEENESTRKADIIFITDGDCRVSPDWKDRFEAKKEELGFTVYGIAIDTSRPTPTETLTSLSDEIQTLHDVLKDEEIIDKVYGI
jgi:uncharacterized protein with von Willebrand factor type A (vWA) domain